MSLWFYVHLSTKQIFTKINVPSEILVWKTEFKIQLDVENHHIKNTQNLIATEI